MLSHDMRWRIKKTTCTKELYNMLTIIRERASAEFNVKANWCGECLLLLLWGFVNNSDFFIFLEKKISKYVYIYFVLHRKCLVWILRSGCVILLIVVIMMQVVCYEKNNGKTKRKRGKAQPFCTGCLYVWEELPKINKDTVVNTENVTERLFCSFLSVHTRIKMF